MDPFRSLTENHISVELPTQQQKGKETTEQVLIRAQLHLAEGFIFEEWTLDAEQRQKQKVLKWEYLQSLKPWDKVWLWISIWALYSQEWVVISNDGSIITIEAKFFNKKKKWKRAFSLGDWHSRWPVDYEEGKPIFMYIQIPESHTIQSTRWIPEEARSELQEIYDKAGEEDTTIARYEDFAQDTA